MCGCKYEGCDRPVNARGLCATHYMQQRRAGILPIGTRAPAPVDVRFWRHVQKTDGCWLWSGNKKTNGYGSIGAGGAGGKTLLAHRVSYQIHFGEPVEGFVVMHKCDNPACVNPAHLTLGSYSDNTRDAVSKGRWKSVPPVLSGTKARLSKLTDDDVRFIRNNANIPNTVLAEKYSVSVGTIRKIKDRFSWKHLP